MEPDSVLNAFGSQLRRFARGVLPLLIGVAIFGGLGVVYALVGNGFLVYSWGTTTDTVGINIGSLSDRTCFLSGVSGNLNDGAQLNFGCGNQGEESLARVSEKYPPTGSYWLVAHGGACSNQVNQK